MADLPLPDEPAPEQDVTLDELTAAFAQAMGLQPAPPEPTAGVEASAESPGSTAEAAGAPAATAGLSGEAETAGSVPVAPASILEAMLFVGKRDGSPLAPQEAADLMRGVAVAEIPAMVEDLNRRYAQRECPYEIVGEGAGYRLTLRSDFSRLRDRFYGRVREARLSQAAIDVLAIVAYRQPITAEAVGRLRGKPSQRLLALLVRRRLLRIERDKQKKGSAQFHTTPRFLKLFNLENLGDLPQSEESDQL